MTLDTTLLSVAIGTCAFGLIRATAGPTTTNAAPLRTLAAARGLRIGAATAHACWEQEPAYRDTLVREFNILTAENDMKWAALRPGPDTFDWSRSDPYVAFAEAHGMQVRGHNLCWHHSNPAWLTNGVYARADLIGILSNHIATVVGRYRGRVAMWDVVNEAVDDQAPYGLRASIWRDGIGPDYLDLAFRAAHAADPKAILVYNDYGAEQLGPKADAVYALVRGMLERGVPVHAVGFQMHIEDVDADSFATNMRRFAALGLQVHVTEMDVRLAMPADDAARQRQADVYARVLHACLAEPACTVFQTWGFTDRHSWIPAFFKGYGDALPFDAHDAPKPAYAALQAELLRPAAHGPGIVSR